MEDILVKNLNKMKKTETKEEKILRLESELAEAKKKNDLKRVQTLQVQIPKEKNDGSKK